jgi:hypothetical protein
VRTGAWFYAGALTGILAIGIVAAFVLGDAAASHHSTPKTWVAIVDLALAVAIIGWGLRALGRPPKPGRSEAMVAQMGKVAASRPLAIAGAGLILGNPGGFVLIALKAVSETDPSTVGYLVQWLFFALVALLPLGTALILLLVARDATHRRLLVLRAWLERHMRAIVTVLLVLLVAALLHNGIAGLTA